MKVKYDKEIDVLYISLSEDPVKESDESKSGVIIDYSDKGNVVGIEILDASKNITLPVKLEYETLWSQLTIDSWQLIVDSWQLIVNSWFGYKRV